jgi:hypothetical protein
VDASKLLGPFKPLHGVNGGPWIGAGTYDMSHYFEQVDPPFIRLHDCPYSDPGTVDIHTIFPDFEADVDAKESAVLVSNFADSTSRFVLEIKNAPIQNQLYCSEFIIDDERELEWDREQIFTSKDFRMLIELPKAIVRLIRFTPEPIMRFNGYSGK